MDRSRFSRRENSMKRKCAGFVKKWAGRDLNSRPFGYQPNAQAKLSYRPLDGANYYRLSTVFKGFRNSFNWFAAILEWARSPVWIKAPAFGAGDLKRPDTRGSNPCGPAINCNDLETSDFLVRIFKEKE